MACLEQVRRWFMEYDKKSGSNGIEGGIEPYEERVTCDMDDVRRRVLLVRRADSSNLSKSILDRTLHRSIHASCFSA